MHCGIDCSRFGTNMPDLDPFHIFNFVRTDYSNSYFRWIYFGIKVLNPITGERNIKTKIIINNSWLSSFVRFFKECKPGPLGMASSDIPDSSITASSYQNYSSSWVRLPKYARLGGNRFWLSDGTDTNPWIQVDLDSRYNVSGLQTEGNYGSDKYQYWVTQIKVQVGMIINDLRFLDDGQGKPKVC